MGALFAPGCTLGRRKAAGGSAMLWPTFCWETEGPGIPVDASLTPATWQWYSLPAAASFSCATLHTSLGNSLRNMRTSETCCRGLQIPQISIGSSLCGMRWNKSDQEQLHLVTYRTAANILVPDTTRHLQMSCRIDASIGAILAAREGPTAY